MNDFKIINFILIEFYIHDPSQNDIMQLINLTRVGALL